MPINQMLSLDGVYGGKEGGRNNVLRVVVVELLISRPREDGSLLSSWPFMIVDCYILRCQIWLKSVSPQRGWEGYPSSSGNGTLSLGLETMLLG